MLGALALVGAGDAIASAGNGRGATVAPGPPPAAATSKFAVGRIVVTYTYPNRWVRLPDGDRVLRRIVTVIRYPALGVPSNNDLPGAPAATQDGPFPLIVFGHGFRVTPAIYARLLRSWAAAGYVVAAPVFPRSNRYAPGGPDEADLVNQPRDMSLVITRVLAASTAPSGVLTGLVDPRAVAVAGQSDGGSTALADAYNRHFVDPRIKAAVILAGARIPGLGGYRFTPGEPPLLAVQGTDDDLNLPSSTYVYYIRARRPKFLLALLGATHLSPFTTERPQLGVVERVSAAFLDLYLKHRPGALERMLGAGDVARVATLISG